VIACSVRLLERRGARLGVMYAAAHHRPDKRTSAHLVTTPIPDCGRFPSAARELQRWSPPHLGAQVIDDQAAARGLHDPKFRWSAFHQTYLAWRCATRNIRYAGDRGRLDRCRRGEHRLRRARPDTTWSYVSDACTSRKMTITGNSCNASSRRMARVRTAAQVLRMLAG